MTLEEFYRAVGGDYRAVMERMVTEDRVIKFLKIFAKDECYSQLCHAVDAGDSRDAFEKAHMLKGIVVNFNLDRLYQIDFDFVEQLRPGTGEIDRKQFQLLQEEYKKVMACIEALDETK